MYKVYKCEIKDDEKKYYQKCIAKSGGIQLQEIAFGFCKFKLYEKQFVSIGDIVELKKLADFNKATTQKEWMSTELTEFTRKFKWIQSALAIDNTVFIRKGKKNSYNFSYNEAIFLRQLIEHAKKVPIWNKIIKINNRDQLGFLNFYYKTEQKQAFFDELTFVVEELVDLFDKDYPSKSPYIRKHIYSTTKYPYIKVLSSLNQIPLLSVDKLLSCGTAAYAAYNNYLTSLYYEIDNLIYEKNKALYQSFLEAMLIEKQNPKNLDEEIAELVVRDNALNKLIENLKAIDPHRYTDLAPENLYQYFGKIEIEAYADHASKRKVSPESQHNNQTFIFQELRDDLMKALQQLSQHDRDVLSEDLLIEFFQ